MAFVEIEAVIVGLVMTVPASSGDRLSVLLDSENEIEVLVVAIVAKGPYADWVNLPCMAAAFISYVVDGASPTIVVPPDPPHWVYV